MTLKQFSKFWDKTRRKTMKYFKQVKLKLGLNFKHENKFFSRCKRKKFFPTNKDGKT